jgi:hypothetical protein
MAECKVKSRGREGVLIRYYIIELALSGAIVTMQLEVWSLITYAMHVDFNVETLS